jgi:hypothetical protein
MVSVHIWCLFRAPSLRAARSRCTTLSQVTPLTTHKAERTPARARPSCGLQIAGLGLKTRHPRPRGPSPSSPESESAAPKYQMACSLQMRGTPLCVFRRENSDFVGGRGACRYHLPPITYIATLCRMPAACRGPSAYCHYCCSYCRLRPASGFWLLASGFWLLLLLPLPLPLLAAGVARCA